MSPGEDLDISDYTEAFSSKRGITYDSQEKIQKKHKGGTTVPNWQPPFKNNESPLIELESYVEEDEYRSGISLVETQPFPNSDKDDTFTDYSQEEETFIKQNLEKKNTEFDNLCKDTDGESEFKVREENHILQDTATGFCKQFDNNFDEYFNRHMGKNCSEDLLDSGKLKNPMGGTSVNPAADSPFKAETLVEQNIHNTTDNGAGTETFAEDAQVNDNHLKLDILVGQNVHTWSRIGDGVPLPVVADDKNRTEKDYSTPQNCIFDNTKYVDDGSPITINKPFIYNNNSSFSHLKSETSHSLKSRLNITTDVHSEALMVGHQSRCQSPFTLCGISTQPPLEAEMESRSSNRQSNVPDTDNKRDGTADDKSSTAEEPTAPVSNLNGEEVSKNIEDNQREKLNKEGSSGPPRVSEEGGSFKKDTSHAVIKPDFNFLSLEATLGETSKASSQSTCIFAKTYELKEREKPLASRRLCSYELNKDSYSNKQVIDFAGIGSRISNSESDTFQKSSQVCFKSENEKNSPVGRDSKEYRTIDKPSYEFQPLEVFESEPKKKSTSSVKLAKPKFEYKGSTENLRPNDFRKSELNIWSEPKQSMIQQTPIFDNPFSGENSVGHLKSDQEGVSKAFKLGLNFPQGGKDETHFNTAKFDTQCLGGRNAGQSSTQQPQHAASKNGVGKDSGPKTEEAFDDFGSELDISETQINFLEERFSAKQQKAQPHHHINSHTSKPKLDSHRQILRNIIADLNNLNNTVVKLIANLEHSNSGLNRMNSR